MSAVDSSSSVAKTMTAQTAQDVLAELLSQPAFFLEFDGVKGLELPTAAAKAEQRYTGSRSTANERKVLLVGALRLLGASDRQIEEACHVTRRTIPVILADLEKSGRITPLKERLARATGDNAERANIALRELLDQVGHPVMRTERVNGENVEVINHSGNSMELAAMIKALATTVGITVEKTLLLTGQATEIVETRVRAGREEFDAWWREQVVPVQASVQSVVPAQVSVTGLETVAGAPGDLPSPGALPISEGITTNEPRRDGSDTAGGAQAEPLEAGQDPARGQDPGAEGGGGDLANDPPGISPTG